MTALVVFDLKETYDFSQEIKISREAVNQEEDYGQLKEGERLSVENLIYTMLIESSNDAAFALSEPVSQDGFVDLMNIYAKNLGLGNAKFANPTGLVPDDSLEARNLSSASDLARLAKYILKNYPRLLEITTINSYEVFRSSGAFHHFISANTNKLLEEFSGIVGGKTGWTEEAGGCLLLIIKNPRRNSYFVNVVLGAGDRFEEMRKIIETVNGIQPQEIN